jgi:electron transfer flavoprotein alpha subunit
MHPSIIVIAEHEEGKVRPITYELAALAVELGRRTSAEIRLVVLGGKAAAAEVASRTGLHVVAIRIPGLCGYNAEGYKDVLFQLFSEWRPSYVCAAHSIQGLDFAPGLAVRLGAACITGVIGLAEEEGRIGFSRTVCSGKMVADVAAETPTQVICLQPGCMDLPAVEALKPGRIEVRTMESAARKTKSLGTTGQTLDSSALTEAEVIVAAGRGIGKAENLGLIQRLAQLFPRSAVGGSRIVCDLGWLDYRQQVGVTGCTVAPELYIACGISGAVQHLCGMQGAGFVVSINTDPKAAIFNASDVCIVEDLTSFIPLLIETYRKQGQEPAWK